MSGKNGRKIRRKKDLTVENLEGFIALEYLGDKDIENLANLGVSTFIGSDDNSDNENFLIFC